MIRKILKKLSWFIFYLLFNAVLFFIEVSVLFTTNDGFTGGSGFESVDDVLEALNVVFNILEGMVMVFYLYTAIGLAIVALLLFIPVQVYYINRKFKNHRKKFLYSLLASFAVVMTLKLLLYAWMFIDLNYL
ncbi:hypothetical protein [Maribacter dokdonensis]|uniref:hypothetical protein n=1 Tax=Maribacter dokdonensis TaxID=320912 RepID=UPI0007199283|nr:hypothetical protein [Maribacter dokdonensis]KSA14120.1 hypothetical protein I600_713 [Maribacter dokdonensis DSW-8]